MKKKKWQEEVLNVQQSHSIGVENGNPFQYSCLENYMERGSWQATILSDTTEQLSSFYTDGMLSGGNDDILEF